MLDFLRSLRKSAEEKRQEQINAYLDGELSPRDLEQFEQELVQDDALRVEVEALRQIQMSVRQMPRVRAPRNYTLDPAVYGQPAQSQSAGWQLYPALRVATALTAFFFIVALALDLMTPAGALDQPVAALMAPAAGDEQATTAETAAEDMAFDTMQEEAVTEGDGAAEVAPLEAEAPEAGAEADAANTAESMAATVEGTRVLTEEVEVAEEEAAEEEPAADEPVEEAETDEPGPAPAAAETEVPEELDGDDAAMAAPPEGTPGADERALTEPTAPLPSPDPNTASVAQQDAPDPFPWLLLAEILLGVGLVGLVVLTLIARRGG